MPWAAVHAKFREDISSNKKVSIQVLGFIGKFVCSNVVVVAAENIPEVVPRNEAELKVLGWIKIRVRSDYLDRASGVCNYML